VRSFYRPVGMAGERRSFMTGRDHETVKSLFIEWPFACCAAWRTAPGAYMNNNSEFL
jgi:hypothetical protein